MSWGVTITLVRAGASEFGWDFRGVTGWEWMSGLVDNGFIAFLIYDLRFTIYEH